MKHPDPRQRSITLMDRQSGAALLTALWLVLLIGLIIVAYSRLTLSEMRTSQGEVNETKGFHASEGGVNLRADNIRSTFVGYNRPGGEGPNATSPCTPGNMGSGDMICKTYKIGDRNVVTYVQDITSPPSGYSNVVSAGESFEGLAYTQYTYRIRSEARSSSGNVEARTELTLQSRLVPLFQFAAFYTKDLEFHPGADMTLTGRIHTNGDMYLNSGAPLNLNGTVTAAKDIKRFGKVGDGNRGGKCFGSVKVNSISVDCSVGTLTPESAKPFGGKLLSQQNTLSVPAMGSISPIKGNQLWDRADVRIVVKKTGTLTKDNSKAETNPDTKVIMYPTYNKYSYEVQYADGSKDLDATQALNADGVITQSQWWDKREQKFYDLFNVDQTKLLDSIAKGKYETPDGDTLTIKDSTDGGLAINMSVDDGDPKTNDGVTETPRPYAFRMGGSAGAESTIASTAGVQPKAIALISNQPVYTWGDFNTTNKIPASIISDALNVLSNSAPLNMKIYQKSSGDSSAPKATNTTVNAAFLSGVDDTNTTDGYNGGLQNYPRFHEDWGGGITFTYRGSFVSLGNSLHTAGPQGSTRYTPPNRDWNFDQSFLDANNLPPLTPRFVYLRQLNFARSY